MDRAEITAPGGRLTVQKARTWTDAWTLGVLLVAFVVAMPLAAVLWIAISPETELWRHLIETVLWLYIGNTLALGAGVAVGTAVIGVSGAWLVTMCRFPGRRVFEWALLVPLAVPTYVIAYTYTDILEYAGPVQGALRALFGWQSARDYWFPEIRSLGGAIVVFSLVLYPYVYLLARAAFLAQSIAVIEVSGPSGGRLGAPFAPSPCRWRGRRSSSGWRWC